MMDLEKSAKTRKFLNVGLTGTCTKWRERVVNLLKNWHTIGTANRIPIPAPPLSNLVPSKVVLVKFEAHGPSILPKPKDVSRPDASGPWTTDPKRTFP